MHLNDFCAPLPSAQQMRNWDAAALTYGIAETMLMENAAREAFIVLQQEYGNLEGKNILLFMGNGNNGGDAVCLARHLLDAGARPLVLHTKPLQQYKSTTKQHLNMAKKCGVILQYLGKNPLHTQHLPAPWQKAHIIVDGLLGTGFTGELRPNFAQYITFINGYKEQSYIFSLDIPSGCEALTGTPLAHSVGITAHATVAFAAAKPGLVLPQAAPYVGKLFVRAIGIPHAVQCEYASSFRLIQKHRIARLLNDCAPSAKKQSHKNSWGHVLVLGGSIQKVDLSGAAHLTALAALRTGAGLVTAAAPKAVCASVKNSCPNIMTLALSPPNAPPELWPSALPHALAQKLSQVHALAIGPGMGTDQDSADILQAVLELPERPRAVIDADALTLIAASATLQKLVRQDDILCPHPGEAARFLHCSSKDVQAQRFETMIKLTELLPCVWLLKGAGTLISQKDSPLYILPEDTAALAIAGSGDVLTGCMAALMARMASPKPLESLPLAALGAVIHAKAGSKAQKLYPQRGHMASDLAHFLPKALHALQKKSNNSLQSEVYSLEYK